MNDDIKQITDIFEIIGDSYYQIRDIAFSLYSNTNIKKWDSFQNISGGSPFTIHSGEVEEVLTRMFCYGSNIYYSDSEYYSMSFSFAWNQSYYLVYSEIEFYDELKDDSYTLVWQGKEYRVDTVEELGKSLKLTVIELKTNIKLYIG
jgi:hypothetical protein